MGDIVDEVNVGTALKLLGSKKRPTAGCPKDDEPLIPTFERSGAEFYCLECGTYYGFLSPKPLEDTPELDARYKELKARFDAGERHGAVG